MTKQSTTDIAILASRFPNLSETFIAAQVEGLIARGAKVDVVSLTKGDQAVRADLEAKLGAALNVFDVPVPKTFPARLGQAPGALAKLGLAKAGAALDVGAHGEDARSLRLLSAAAAWPEAMKSPRVWLAHYGRWGRFAVALRQMGLIQGPIATVFHGKDMSAYLRKRPNAYRDLFRHGDLFLPISEKWRAKLLEMGAPSERTIVHRMGVDVSRFSFRARSLGAGEPIKFLGVGRLVEKKGFADSIAAYAHYIIGPDAPPATLTIIGQGKLKSALEAQAAKLGVSDRVRFTGGLPHARVQAELDAAHVFVLPSVTASDGDMEGVPVALMEAMAAGLPVLSTTHSGIPELIEHDASGLLAPERDPQQLAANMRALALAPQRWPAMGAAGAKRVRDEFDLKAWNDALYARLKALA